jgi:hypothetical protein
MGRVTLDAGQAAYLVEHRIDHPGVETAVTVGVGDRRKKHRRRFPFLKKISCPHVINPFDSMGYDGYPIF